MRPLPPSPEDHQFFHFKDKRDSPSFVASFPENKPIEPDKRPSDEDPLSDKDFLFSQILNISKNVSKILERVTTDDQSHKLPAQLFNDKSFMNVPPEPKFQNNKIEIVKDNCQYTSDSISMRLKELESQNQKLKNELELVKVENEILAKILRNVLIQYPDNVKKLETELNDLIFN